MNKPNVPWFRSTKREPIITHIKDWRASRHAMGMPSGLDDWRKAHNACEDCQGRGLRSVGPHMGKPKTTWVKCGHCEGTGTYQGRKSWEATS